MLELVLRQSADALEVTFGEYQAMVPWADVAPTATTGQRLYDDAVAYGKTLFEQVFPDESLRTALTSLRANERLLLVIDDPLVAAIPWEYLRDIEGRLLASRLTLVRAVSEAHHHDALDFTRPLHLVALPVSPIDDPRLLDTEGEWEHVVSAVSFQGKALTLTRVRPPTLERLERTLTAERMTLVHFMGHSDSRDGKGLLAFEDARGRSHLIEAADFAETLAATNIVLVMLNSCRSALAWDWTSFGNIARGLVREGIPYALGMQFVLPDDAALALSQAFYDFLLQGRSIEEAVRRTRRALEHDTTLRKTAWLVGIPVLYTSLREQPAGPLQLADGQPTIQPDPERIRKTRDLTALPQATHFVGRNAEISQTLDALLAYSPADFVVLHGLGGIGKTSLAHAVTERISYAYEDRVLALSFETFARLDESSQRSINEQFAERFYNRLARYYELDPAQFSATIDLQQAILQARRHTRSLLVLDNIETLIDALKQDHPMVKALATFVSRLKEGQGSILLTSRMMLPADWGTASTIEVPGLQDAAGSDLFLALLAQDRQHLAQRAARIALSHRVQGHPLSIQLLAGRFSETTIDLATFLTNIEAELAAAKQATPTSLEDPERQKTLYACMDYSVNRLAPEQRMVLDAVSLFQAPFQSEYVAYALNDEEQTPVHLQNLLRLGLLTMEIRTFKEGELLLLDMHPMLRWYIQQQLSGREPALLERYGQVYEHLARQAYQNDGGYDQSARMRYLVRQSLPDFEAALQYLLSAEKSSLAYHLAYPYHRLGQNRQALALYQQALKIDQELGDVRGVSATQNAMAHVLRQLGKPQEALDLYEQALHTAQEIGEVRGVSATQQSMAHVLRQLGKPQEALDLYEQALHTAQEIGEVRGVSATQQSMANVLSELGKPQEALDLYEQALHTAQEIGEVRGVSTTQYAMANVLSELGKPQEALDLYEQALRTYQELGDVRGEALTQNAMANVLRELGKPQEALDLYEQALHTAQEIGEVREVATTQQSMAVLLSELGKPQEALDLYEQALRTYQELGDVRSVAVTQNAMANVLRQLGKPQEALDLYEQALRTKQELGDVRSVAVTQHAMAGMLSELGKPQEALDLYEQALRTYQELGDVRSVAATQQSMANVLRQLGKPQEALDLYEQALHTAQEIGEVRGVALTQATYSQLLLQQGEPQRALRMLWESFNSLRQSGFSHDAQSVQSLLIALKERDLGLEQFTKLWAEVITEPQPAWLTSIQARSSSRQAHISSDQLKTIVANTITVMTTMPEKQAEWHETLEEVLKQAQEANGVQETEFFVALLALLDGKAPSLPEDKPYANALNEIQAGIATGVSQSNGSAVSASDEVMQAIRDFVSAEDWDAKQAVVEAQQALLFQPEVETLFEQNIAGARARGEERAISILEQHLTLLRACQTSGLAEAFEQLAAAQAEHLPFDEEVISRSIVALMGSPQEKKAHGQYLTEQLTQTTDEQLKALLETIQLALFTHDLSQLGRDLQGVYRQAWETITVTVEAGGVDPDTFNILVSNTLAVLGPAASQRSEWRSTLTEMRNHTTMKGERNMGALLDNIIGLLDAEGNPAGLGQNLQGIYAQTWHALVQQLPS